MVYGTCAAVLIRTRRWHALRDAVRSESRRGTSRPATAVAPPPGVKTPCKYYYFKKKFIYSKEVAILRLVLGPAAQTGSYIL